MSKLPVALQLYTVRDLSAKDYVDTIEQVAKIGYKWVELARPFPAADVKALFSRLKLKVISGHEGLDGLQKDLPNLIAFYKELGAPYLTLPGLPEAMRTEAAFPGLVKSLNQIGKTLKEAGIQFCYHNHNWEFEVKIGNKTFFDALYANTDPQYLQAQIDVYWVYFAGKRPAALIKRYAGRCPLIHLKDMPKNFKNGTRPARWAEVGEGKLNMAAIYEASEASGAKAYIVEQDLCERPSIESAKLSFENLKKAGKI
jgi:sugar phosphate isomerase/epimerase